MKLIIDIPEHFYKVCKADEDAIEIRLAVKNGIPLDSCEDCISRESILNAITEIDDYCNMDIYTNEVRELVNELPSVQPIRPKGVWRFNNDGSYTCSKCKYLVFYSGDMSNYCPDCGADLRGDNNAKA